MKIFVLSALSAAAAIATAQVTPIGQFTGDWSEDFESFTPGTHYGHMMVMGGNAMFMSDPQGNDQLYAFSPGGWGLGYGSAQTQSGNGLGMENLQNNALMINDLIFTTPAMMFGGWFSTDNIGPDLRLTFFDGGGATIDTLTIMHHNVAMQWFGWSSATPIARIRFNEGFFPAMDDLQASAVPEPASFAVLGAGLLGLAIARRRR